MHSLIVRGLSFKSLWFKTGVNKCFRHVGPSGHIFIIKSSLIRICTKFKELSRKESAPQAEQRAHRAVLYQRVELCPPLVQRGIECELCAIKKL